MARNDDCYLKTLFLIKTKGNLNTFTENVRQMAQKIMIPI